MVKQLKSTVERSRDTLLADAAGAVSLVVLLLGSLALPGLF